MPALDRVSDAQDLPLALRYESGDLGAKELQILECLGAALVSEWDGISTDVQRAIFQHISANRPYDSAQMRTRIARFLHNHKGNADVL